VKENLASQLQTRITKKGQPLKPTDLSTNEAVMKRSLAGVELRLDASHSAFNPGPWEKSGDLFRRKESRGGLAALALVRTIPLNLVIAYGGVAGTAETLRYQFTVTKEYEKQPLKRRATVSSLTPGTKNDVFWLREVRGPKDNPTELVGEYLDNAERFTVARDRNQQRPMAFAADLKYEGRDLPAKRADDALNLSGVTYKVVAITKDEVVVSAPNQVRSTIRLVSAP
jgi:hypothetical protein